MLHLISSHNIITGRVVIQSSPLTWEEQMRSLQWKSRRRKHKDPILWSLKWWSHGTGTEMNLTPKTMACATFHSKGDFTNMMKGSILREIILVK